MTLPLEKYCIEADLGTQTLVFLFTTQISLSLEEIKYNEKESNTNRLETTMVCFMLLGSTCMHTLQVYLSPFTDTCLDKLMSQLRLFQCKIKKDVNQRSDPSSNKKTPTFLGGTSTVDTCILIGS